MARRVVAFSLTGKWAILDDGVAVPITNMFAEGPAERNETDDPDLCVTFVCGSDETAWFAEDVRNFQLVKAD